MIEILKRDKEEREKDMLPEDLLVDEDFDELEDENVENLLAQLSKEEREMFEKALAGKRLKTSLQLFIWAEFRSLTRRKDFLNLLKTIL